MSTSLSSPVSLRIEAGIALITVDNPPVNALSHAVRTGLLQALRAALSDEAVRAAVLLCSGRTFIAGADVTEFGRALQPPHLPEVTQAFEESPKPVVAALHGTTLGGGFEIALACHYRIATPSTTVGLPEVKLGLIPGAGGTQRLPRLVGVDLALKMICNGVPITAAHALESGAIDEITEGDLEVAAATAAERLGRDAKPPRRTGLLSVTRPIDGIFDEAKRTFAKKRELIAPLRCIEAIRAAVSLPFVEGLKRERELFLQLRTSPQAAALRHAFLGEREVGKVPGLSAHVTAREVRRIAVIGAGTMGGGIAMCFANAGFPVQLVEAGSGALERGIATIRKNYAATVTRGALSQDGMDKRLHLITPTLIYEDLREADLIVEAAFEDMDVKQLVFERVDAVAKPGAILATNTSYLDVAAIAEFTGRPQDVLGMHFFSPANVMRLLENVRTPKTAPDVLLTAMKIAKAIGKVAVLVGGADGFVGNRMLAQRTREAYFLLEEGALPEQVDRVLVDFGFPMGPLAVGDLAGLDIGWRNRKARAHLRRPGVRDCNLLDKVCEMGRFGQKSGAGWYRYEAGNRTPHPDPLIEQLILDHARQAGIVRRDISDREILERCLYAMINEGARILGEGVAARAVDIDMVWLHGYGFPAWRGGPMFHADQVGLTTVYEAITRYRDRFGAALWSPAPLLEELAAVGHGFFTADVTAPAIVR